MLKQPACAAASSSSGFDPFLPSKRVPKLNEPLNAPLCALKLPLPSLSLPSQTATALLVAMIDCSDDYRGTGNLARRAAVRSEEHTSELQSRLHLVCRLLLEKKKIKD